MGVNINKFLNLSVIFVSVITYSYNPMLLIYSFYCFLSLFHFDGPLLF